MIGNQIANFRIVDKLGEGGMGVVFRAVDVQLDRPVAIKMLNAELARDPQVVERFRTEARAQANLNHVNLATLYAFLVDQGNAFMVMEFVEGETFEQIINRRGPIPPEDAVPWFKQALLGIGAAHRMGIIHRDIKPSNLMLNRQGIVKVMDFGIAKVVGARGMTRTGMQPGTLPYMSPEQIQNRPVDMRTDIYALGITLYQMLSGHVPFESDSDFEIMNGHITAPPPPLTRMYPYAPVQYENVVMKVLEKNPDNRYQTVEQFGAALEHPESVPGSSGAAAILPGVKPTIIEMPRPPLVAGSTALAAAPAAAAPAPAYASPVTVPQTQSIAAIPPAPQPVASPAAGKITWDSRYTAAAAIAAAALILLAILMFGRKPPTAQNPAAIASAPAGSATPAPQQPEVTVTPQSPSPPPPSGQSQGQRTPAAPAAPRPNSPPSAQQPKPAASPKPESAVVIPGGTHVVVRTIDAIDSRTAVAGRRFSASLDEPIAVGDRTVVAKNADAVLEIAGMKKGGHIKGRSELSIQLVSLKIRGRTLPVQTDVHSAQGPSRGSNTAKKAGGAGAAGAVLGGIFGGGKGAFAGGAIGVGGAMAFQMATHGSKVQIPSESRIEFVLTQDASFSSGSAPAAGSASSPEFGEVAGEVDQLTSRAAAMNNRVDRLQRQQAAAGFGLRGDIASTQASMQGNLSKAQSAVQGGDLARARKYAELTEADLQVLERLLAN